MSRVSPTNNAPGSAGQNGAQNWAEDLIAKNNARLRLEAAAPDLLEALREALDIIEEHEPENGPIADTAFLRTAIAKATGEGV